MTAPEMWTVTDPDGGWEVYIPNASGGWRLVSSQGGTAVVDTLPDGAEGMVAVPSDPDELAQVIFEAAGYTEYGDPERNAARAALEWMRGDRRG